LLDGDGEPQRGRVVRRRSDERPLVPGLQIGWSIVKCLTRGN
jgi:hypothetical protein